MTQQNHAHLLSHLHNYDISSVHFNNCPCVWICNIQRRHLFMLTLNVEECWLTSSIHEQISINYANVSGGIFDDHDSFDSVGVHIMVIPDFICYFIQSDSWLSQMGSTNIWACESPDMCWWISRLLSRWFYKKCIYISLYSLLLIFTCRKCYGVKERQVTLVKQVFTSK